MITVTCGCGGQFQVADDAAGRRAPCPTCGKVLTVPADGLDDVVEVHPMPSQGSSGKAVASLILGLLSFACNFFAGLPAIIFGILSLRDINNSRGRLSGKGLAITGIVTGTLGPLLLFPLLWFSYQKKQGAGNRMISANNLKQIGLALHNYESTYGTLPPAVVYDAQGKPLHSWRVLILPFLEQDTLFRQLDLRQPWDSPRNRDLLSRMPKTYRHPSVSSGSSDTTTFYQMIVGKGALFEAISERKARLGDIRDGASNTIMVVEAANGVHWAKPEDLPFDPDGPLPKIGVPSLSGTHVAFADGAVRWMPKGIDEKTLRAMITRAGSDPFVMP